MKVILLQIKSDTIYHDDYDSAEVLNSAIPKSEWIDMSEDKIIILERYIARTKYNAIRYVLIKEMPDMSVSIQSLIDEQLKHEKVEAEIIAKREAERKAKAERAAAKKKKTDLEKKKEQLEKLQKELAKLEEVTDK